MNARTKMILALGITATMLAVVFAAVPGDDSEAAPGPSITTHPYYSNCSTFVSNGPITYTGSGSGNTYYFTEDPTSDIHRVMRCEMAFNDLQTVSPVNGNDYWVMRYTYNTSLTGYTRLIDDVPLVFLDKGTWTVNVVSVSWSASNVYFSSNNTSQFIPLTDGHGSSEQFNIDRPLAYTFSTGDNSTPWYAQTVTYSTDPVSSKTPAPAYTGTAKLLSDYHWKKYTTTATFTGEVQNSNYIMFEKDSAEETAFINNIVNLNKYDGSAYANNPITVDSKQVVLYACEKISNWSSSVPSIYLGVDSGSGYVYNNYNVTTTEVPTGTEVNSKITVNPQFSIAVQFDTSRIQYVKMTQSSGGYS
ncbi:MAG: hypothetical protein II855_00990, partial [Candidatus Methanomethylophilaceae archaeon]|nr:hypothetical protein [Candidatus Methanomethylophilaceae archaeon]